MWDINMQTECCKTFQNDEVLQALSSVNREMLLMQVLEIIGMTDLVLYQRVGIAALVVYNTFVESSSLTSGCKCWTVSCPASISNS